MPAVAIALCREGFEAEAAADLARIAALARAPIETVAEHRAAHVIVRLQNDDPPAWRRAALALPPIFVRSLFTGTGPHAIAVAGANRPDRIAPLVFALERLAERPAHAALWRNPWIEYPDTNEGKSLSTLARALDARLANALRERGLLDDTSHHQPHVLLVDGASAYVGTSDADTGSPWPLGIPRLRMPREAPSRSTLKLVEAIAVFLGERADTLLHAGQSAVDLGAAPGGWTSQLVARGLQVAAVDNGALAPRVACDPNVEHIREDGLRWRPRRPVDWLVCDIVERPSRIAALVADWIASGSAQHAIFNLKLPMKKRHDEVLRCAALIHDRLDCDRVEATLAFRQLYHDREEVTGCVLRRDRAAARGRRARTAPRR